MSDRAEQPHGTATRWREIHDRLDARPPEELTAAELDTMADALFWLNEPRRSIELRHRAFLAWCHQGAASRAARATWFLFYEHWLVGEAVVARGWLERGRRLLFEADPDSEGEITGWLAVAEADVLLADGRREEALRTARRATRIGSGVGSVDLLAMALQAEGRMLVANGYRSDGLGRLDEAMVSVIANELEPLYTGWIYCNVIATCRNVGDLQRANEWSAAALRWCTSIRDGLLYPGLCQVYAAELALLRGEWAIAESQARRACDDLAVYDRRYAGAAYYLVGELCRLQGRLDEADVAYQRANELGRNPLPGMALLRARSDRTAEGLGSLLSAVEDLGGANDAAILPALDLLTALFDVADLADDADGRAAAIAGFEDLGQRTEGCDVLQAHLLSARGRAAADDVARENSGDDERPAARDLLHSSRELFQALGMPYEAIRQGMHLAQLAERRGDHLSARLERQAAAADLARLGAAPDSLGPTPDPDPDPDSATALRVGPRIEPDLESVVGSATALVPTLSNREREVLGLVAGGMTNAQVAARLHLSPHTVARHLSNIFTKLGVRSRAAATAAAVAAGLSAADSRGQGPAS